MNKIRSGLHVVDVIRLSLLVPIAGLVNRLNSLAIEG